MSDKPDPTNIDQLQYALRAFAYYFEINDCEERKDHETLEIPIGDLRRAARLMKDTWPRGHAEPLHPIPPSEI